MDNKKIECFLAVAETQSFSRAADKLYKNQSVVSKQVAALEKELGVQLFTRGSRVVTLTPAGRVFENGIRKIGENYSALLMDTADAQRGYSGEIKIGLHPGHLYTNNIMPILRAFERDHPEICISLVSAYSADISQRIDEGQLDAVFWRWEEYSGPFRDSIGIVRAENGLLFSRGHPALAEEKQHYELIDFRDETFFVMPDSLAPGLGRRLLRMCIESGFQPKIEEVSNHEACLLMISMQRGTIAMNSMGFPAHIDAFQFVHIPQLGFSEMSLIWDTRDKNPCMNLFLEYVRAYRETHRTDSAAPWRAADPET